jgi:hypothetical protein
LEHRDGLIQALITHIDVERKLLPYTVFGDPERTVTRERIQTMESMIARAQASEHTIVIDGTVVRLLRSGTYASLGFAADDLPARTNPAERETDPDEYTLALERLDGVRSLLNVLGWCRVESERQIEFEVRRHRVALTEAARIALDTSEDAESANRPAAEHIQGLQGTGRASNALRSGSSVATTQARVLCLDAQPSPPQSDGPSDTFAEGLHCTA